RTVSLRIRRMSWLQFKNAESRLQKAETATGRSFLPSAPAPPRIAPKISRKPDPHRSQVDYCGVVSGWHTQAFPADMAKQPQALHFFNTAAFSCSEKFAYNEYAARHRAARTGRGRAMPNITTASILIAVANSAALGAIADVLTIAVSFAMATIVLIHALW